MAVTEGALREWLTDYLVTVIGCGRDEVDGDAPVRDLGLGSTDAVVLSGELTELLGRPVSAVELFEHPTINALSAALAGADDEVAAVERSSADTAEDSEAVAVIGVGCRFPGGAEGPQSYWSFLESGECAVGQVPDGRWDGFIGAGHASAEAARTTTKWGAFLPDLAAFDAEHFGISPNEAEKMDPQQRLVLEVTSEALEHAGIATDSLAHTATGVYVGACAGEYGYLVGSDLSAVDGWSGTGAALSVISNRVSYALDLRGPSVTVDTACSSSLVTVHLACRGLRSHETDLAIAAGVNVMLSPAVTRSFDQLSAMSPTGRCHSFDAAADGYVRGEGCGVVVLKRLSDAVRDGDRVLAVVRGSAVNQDGRSNGLTAPSPAAQAAVLRSAYADASISPREVDFVETHGTGTLLGDPIEARALGTVLGRGRAQGSELLLGAVKSNLGHLEAAAGVAGFIKTVLALQHGSIPANVGYTTPNPHIPFDAHRLRVVGESTAWPATGRPRRAGVSSFGFGGTNAHVVLEQAPENTVTGADVAAAGAPANTPVRLTVPAGSAARVRIFAAALAEWLEDSGAHVPLPEVAGALASRRMQTSQTGTVVAADHAAAVRGLRAMASGTPAPGVVAPHAPVRRSGVVFVFSGQGSQWAGMGARLLESEPRFAAAVAELESDFVEQTGFSLTETLRSEEPVVGIDRIQPLLVGLQLALVGLWRSYGVVPAAVIGHSMGEVTAAVVSGGLSVADGLRVIATRSRLMRRELSGRGAMAMIEMDEESAQRLVSEFEGVSVAVIASPRQSVVAGDPLAIDALIEKVAAQGLMARRVEVDVASHHSTVDPILGELRAALSGITPRTPTIAVLSTVRPGDDAPVFDADYWATNLRAPVRFADAVVAAGERWGTLVEVSPHPLLTHAIGESLPAGEHRVTGTLARDSDSVMDFQTALASVGEITAIRQRAPHVDLPPTPWVHERFWVSAPRAADEASTVPRPGTLLGGHVAVAGSAAAHLWRARLAPDARSYPGGHSIQGVELVPVSVLLQTFTAAAREIGAGGVDRVAFLRPVVLDRPRLIQVVVEGDALTLSSATSASGPFTRHATARIATGAPPVPIDGRGPAAAIRATPAARTEWGVEGTPYPWSIGEVRAADGVLIAAVDTGSTTPDDGPEDGGPATALLDAAVAVARMTAPADHRLLVPAGARSIHVLDRGSGTKGTVTVRIPAGSGEESEPLLDGVDVDIAAEGGQALARIRGLAFAPIEDAAVLPDAEPHDIVHTLEWRQWTPELASAPGTAAVLGDEGAAALLVSAGIAVGAALDRADQVVYAALPTTGEDDLAAAERYTCDLVEIVRRMVDTRATGRLWVLTRGVADGADATAPPQAALWGIAGVVATEHPELWGGVLDLAPAEPSSADLTAVATALSGRSSTPLRVRDGRVTSPLPVPVNRGGGATLLRCRTESTYLVTGGLGSLGTAIAHWLADRGARRIVLAGRTALPSRAEWPDVLDPELRRRIDAVTELEHRGVAVEVVALDIAEPGSLAAWVADRDERGAPPVRGVVHAAGIESSALLADLDPATVRAVLAPKVAGAQAIDAAFPVDTVDFIHLVGSAGAVFGVPGQGAYAAANAYLDGLARRRDHVGAIDTVALDWVAWEGMGFGARAEVVRQELERVGSRPVRAAEAFAAWDYAAGLDLPQVVMLPRQSTDGGAEPTEERPIPAWAQLPPDEALRGIEDGLRDIVARELRLDPAELTADRPFAEIGLNSVMAMSIRRDAENLVGTELSVTMLWNHPTLGGLARYLAERVGAIEAAPAGAPADPEEQDGTGLLDSLFDSAEGTLDD
ncbi:type I polyketide synthase [Tsukamurella asaccharolytica]|uniref:type I polyketide synthase n=1 Tax=Tsukamurella asaccharolytica TaxID=2592067 RepID=UPI001E5D7380|nr:type I polyketide synthase [Tsukamurella asaccharolytica]